MAEKWYGRFIGQPVEALDSGQLIGLLQEVEEENNWKSYEAQLMVYSVFTVFCSYMRYMVRNENYVPLATEVETYAPTDLLSRDGRPIFLHGIIDLLVDRNGDFGICDHKSHTNRPWSQSQLTFDLQLFFYSLLLVLQGVHVDFAAINTVNLFIPKGKNEAKNQESLNNDDRFDRMTVEHSKSKLSMFQDEIFKHIKEMWVDDFSHYPMSITRNCAKCGFAEVCDMKLSGGDIGALLRNKYTATNMTILDDLDFETENS
jgi:hypothetical protein